MREDEVLEAINHGVILAGLAVLVVGGYALWMIISVLWETRPRRKDKKDA